MSEVKYRHPQESSLTWSGRGKQPKWFSFAIESGFTEDQLLADKQQSAQELDCIDLGIGEVQSKNTEPTLAEKLYAGRIVEGVTPEPAVDDPTYSAGTQLEVAKIRQVAAEPAEVTPSPVADGQEGRDLMNQLLGQAQMADAMRKFSQTIGVSKLAFVKENKIYQSLRGIKTPNGDFLSGTWKEFCSLLGMSDEKANQDIANLRAFGEEALESMSRMGIGYRELRQFRKLPQDQREALAQIATSGNKEDVLEAAYEAIEAERAKRSDLEVKNAELGEDLKLAERRAKNLDTECERKDIQIKRLSESKQRTTDFLLRTEELREECMALQLGAELHLNSLKRLFEETDAQAPEGTLQMEQLWVVAHTLAARSLDLLAFMRARVPDGMPDRPMTQHMLTPEEAIRWLHDYPLIENRFAAEAAVRESRREAARPKGPGRPKGSTNKAAAE